MKHFPIMGWLAISLSGMLITHAAWASRDALNLAGPEFLLFSAQGYLGVDLGEVDSDHTSAVPKDAHGAEVVMVDHDAPAGKSGLKEHDVILQLDAKPFDSVDQLRRRLRELPSGRTVSLLISRDGSRIYVTVQLCDRTLLQQQAWSKHYSVQQPGVPVPKVPAAAFVGHPPSRATAFIDAVIPRGLYVGAEMKPVRTQLADYFGVTSGTGLLVENVEDPSPAAKAGLKAGDVVVKVAGQPMTNRNDWVKSMRRHRGQLVQVTVMRNKQEQVLTMSAGRLKKN